jgi:hypothetical protein
MTGQRGSRSWQSQRDSNPCRHLENLTSPVQSGHLNRIYRAQQARFVLTVRSVPFNIAERMDGWMDNSLVSRITGHG